MKLPRRNFWRFFYLFYLKKSAYRCLLDSKKESTGDVSDEEDIDNAVADLTQSAGKYIDKSKLLPKGVISVTCLNNITQGHRFGKVSISCFWINFFYFETILRCFLVKLFTYFVLSTLNILKYRKLFGLKL